MDVFRSEVRKQLVRAAFLSALVAGCGSSSDGGVVRVSLEDLPCRGLSEIGVWQSAPPPPFAVDDCRWLPYRGNTTYVFEHDLGRMPTIVLGYIAFESDGLGATVASGNAFGRAGEDEDTVAIRNSQDQDFFLQLVLF